MLVMPMSDFLLLLPTLNEEEALEALGAEIPEWMDALVVDGGSTDGTRQIAGSLGYGFLTQRFGSGKGCGVRTGMEYFLGRKYDYMGMIDTDYTSVPSELERMLEEMKSGGYDLVLGARDRKKQRELLGRFSLFINTSTSGIVSFAYRMRLPDIQTSYWLFSRKAVEALYPRLVAAGFEIEYDMVYNSWKEGMRIGTVPVTIRERLGETKFTNYLRLKQIYHGLRYVKKSLLFMLLGNSRDGGKPG
jgi:glycosyltransferase involved in cell wall biosynthesis